LNDFEKAIELAPKLAAGYIGRARTYERMNNIEAAIRDYQVSCLMGLKNGCDKFNALSGTK
jgi:Tfp pilus assembly protein PilF